MQPMTDRRAWDIAVDLGFVAFTVGAVVVQVVLAGEAIPPLIAIPVLLAIALVVRRFRYTWGAIAAAILGVAAIAGNVPFLLDDLTHPIDAPLQFTVTLLMLVGALAVIIGSIGGLLSWDGGGVRPFVGALSGIVVLGGLVSFGLWATSEEDDVRPGDVHVLAKDIEFAPRRIEADQRGALYITNDDPIRHTFTIDRADIDMSLRAGKSERLRLNLQPGRYDVYCDVPGHDDMQATLVIRPAGPG